MGGGKPLNAGAAAKALAVVSTLIGVLVLAFGLLQFAAAIAAAPSAPILSALEDGQHVSDAALERLLASRQAANAWAQSPRFYRDIGRAAHILAQRAGDDRARADTAFSLAAEATENGLRLAPVDPISWLRLAAIRLDVDRDPRAALMALRSAVRSGPYDPVRSEARVRIILRLWPFLDRSDRVLFQLQFRHLWNDHPATLARLALDERVYLIALAMLDDPKSADELAERRDALQRSPQ